MHETTAVASSEPLSDREFDAWGGFLRTHALLVRELDAELTQAHGLPLSSYEVLLKLGRAEQGRMRMSDLADAVWLSRSGVTRLVDRLERDGLVERRACPSDARGAFAVITERGRQRFGEAQRTHLAGIRTRFLAHFDDADQRAMSEFWSRLTAPVG
jgi:DNA-binding MarR family transcriptional regulator